MLGFSGLATQNLVETKGYLLKAITQNGNQGVLVGHMVRAQVVEASGQVSVLQGVILQMRHLALSTSGPH